MATSNVRRNVRAILGALTVAVCLTGLLGGSALAEAPVVPPREVGVFVYPHTLTAKDKLFDGDKAIEIKGETTLIWIDRHMNARFGHETQYILISAEGKRVVQGSWRPTLNGRELFCTIRCRQTIREQAVAIYQEPAK